MSAGELAALGVVPAPLRRDANAKSSAASWTHRVVGQTRRDSSPRLEGYSRRAEGAEAGTYVGMVIPGGALLATTLIRAEVNMCMHVRASLCRDLWRAHLTRTDISLNHTQVYPVKPLVSPSQANMTSRCNIVQVGGMKGRKRGREREGEGGRRTGISHAHMLWNKWNMFHNICVMEHVVLWNMWCV